MTTRPTVEFIAIVAIALTVMPALQTGRAQEVGQTAPPQYLPNVAIPAACMIAGELPPNAASSACYVVNAVKLANELRDASRDPNALREALKVLAVGANVVILTFPKEMGLDARVALVEAMFEYTAEMFNSVMQDLIKAQQDQAQKQLLATRYALADAQMIQALKQQAFAQQKAFVEAARNYLLANPDVPGLQFQCVLACNQLISAAQGVDVFDNPTPTADSNNTQVPANTSHALRNTLIIGGIGAAAGLSIAAACSSGYCGQLGGCGQPPTIPSSCLGSGRNTSACNAAINAYSSWCSCNGRTFNVGTGACQ